MDKKKFNIKFAFSLVTPVMVEALGKLKIIKSKSLPINRSSTCNIVASTPVYTVASILLLKLQLHVCVSFFIDTGRSKLVQLDVT